MSKFVYTVVVIAENKEIADHIMCERLDHDVDNGYSYKIEDFHLVSSQLMSKEEWDDCDYRLLKSRFLEEEDE